jgi:hypothetical protein
VDRWMKSDLARCMRAIEDVRGRAGGVGDDPKRAPAYAQRQRPDTAAVWNGHPPRFPAEEPGWGCPARGAGVPGEQGVLVRALAQGWPCRMRLLCQGECGGAKYCAMAWASPAAMTCWPRLLAAIEPSKGSVMNSGSMSAPGIWLGVLK